MLYINTALLPNESDSLATKDEAASVVAKYGNPTEITAVYQTHLIVEFKDDEGNFLDSLPVSKACLFSGDSLQDLTALYNEYHGYKLNVKPSFI